LNLVGAQARGFVGRQFVLRVIAFLRGLGELVGQLIGTLGLCKGVGDGLVAVSLGIGQILLGLLEIVLRLDQFLFVLASSPCVKRQLSLGVAVGDERLILSLTKTKFTTPTASAAITAKIKLMRINMAVSNFQQALNLWRGCVNAVCTFQKLFFIHLGRVRTAVQPARP
jgi:hypothetical protein